MSDMIKYHSMNTYKETKLHTIINMTVFFTLFMCYTLKFLYPPFYAATDKYAGLFVFLMESVLLLNNFNPFEAIKNKDIDFIVCAVILVIIGVNLIVVGSGYGAYFTAANFILIFYASDKLSFSNNQLKIMSAAYLLMLMFWLIVLYHGYFGSYDASFALNTNGAATFTVYTFFCAYILLADLFEKYRFVGVFIVILFVRLIRLDIWHRARGAFIILTLFFVFYYIVPKKLWGNKKFITAILFLATFGSIIFVAIYTAVGLSGFNVFVPVFYKNIFSGRENIWFEFFNYFKSKPLTGIGTNITIESFVEFNVHNAMYDILVVHGIIVFAGAMYFIFKRMIKFSESASKNSISLIAYCVLIAVFFESYIDVDLLWADYALNLMFLLAVVKNYKPNNKVIE